jgi:hypothetical protein
MTGCCFENLGCLQIPNSVTSLAGQTGATGTITVGTVTTGAAGSSVTITNVGTPTAAILDFSIPQGDAGATGANGTARLYSTTISSTSSTTGSWTTLGTYTLPANTLANTGDSVVIQATSSQNAAISGFNIPMRRVTIGGVSCTVSGGLEPFIIQRNASADNRYNTYVEIIRTSSTTATCRNFVDGDLNIQRSTSRYDVSVTGIDFTANAVILFQAFQYTGSEVELKTLTIDLLRA